MDQVGVTGNSILTSYQKTELGSRSRNARDMPPSFHHLNDLRYREAQRLVWSPGSNLPFDPVVVIPIAATAPQPLRGNGLSNMFRESDRCCRR